MKKVMKYWNSRSKKIKITSIAVVVIIVIGIIL